MSVRARERTVLRKTKVSLLVSFWEEKKREKERRTTNEMETKFDQLSRDFETLGATRQHMDETAVLHPCLRVSSAKTRPDPSGAPPCSCDGHRLTVADR